MADDDRVQAAAEELYAADPAEFTDRRRALAGQARAAGDKAAARAIGALRRPTRAGWVINQLARADPGAVQRLTGLGDELRAAGSALDGGRLRELSQARRELLGELTRQALDQAGVSDPADALQQEVTGTLSAALADPQVAAEVRSGRLVKPTRPTAFGFAGLAGDDGGEHEDDDGGDGDGGGGHGGGLTSAAPRPAPRKVSRRKREPSQGQRGGGQKRAERERAARERAGRARAELEHQRQAIREAIRAAEQTLAEADHAVDAAHAAEADREGKVRGLEQQLEDAQDALADAKRRSREARTAQRQARKALDRLRDRADQLHLTTVYRAGWDHGRLAHPDGRPRPPRRRILQHRRRAGQLLRRGHPHRRRHLHQR